MLAAVTGPAEAEAATAGGADVIDVVSRTSEADLETIRDVVSAVGVRRSVSAAAGGADASAGETIARATALAASGVDHIRIVLPTARDNAALLNGLAALAPTVRLIAMVFADAAPDLSPLAPLARAGFAGAMLDTQGKGAVRLLDHCDLSHLQGFVAQCHAAGLIAGLSGALELPDIPRLLVLGADVLGFRLALCGPDGRAGAIELARVQTVRGLIPQQDAAPDIGDVDYRLLSARGYPALAGEDVPTDRVLVEDFVLPVFVGAYASERATPQRVRFAVDASVMRNLRTAEDMRDVFSYDLITDGIRMLVDAGHVALVETLAERIAAMVLAHPRVTSVVVRVQKLETGNGTVGVEIERSRRVVRGALRPVVPLLAEALGAGPKS